MKPGQLEIILKISEVRSVNSVFAIDGVSNSWSMKVSGSCLYFNSFIRISECILENFPAEQFCSLDNFFGIFLVDVI